MSQLTDLLDRVRGAFEDAPEEERELAVRVAQDVAVLQGRAMMGGADDAVQRELDLANAAAASLGSAAAGRVHDTFMGWLTELAGDVLARAIPGGSPADPVDDDG